MSSRAIDNLELICRAQTGDTESLAILADQVRRRVYAYIRRVTLQDDLAADLTQDTMVSVLRAIGELKEADRLWPWVFRIASNKISQHYRRESRRSTQVLPESTTCKRSREKSVGDVLTELAQSETAAMTRNALAGMNERQRIVIRLRFYEGLSHSEIARLLDCSELATRTALWRAKCVLVHKLKRTLGVRVAQ